jgi:hypothetical protein
MTILAWLLVSLMALGAGTSLGLRGADAQSAAPGAGLASVRAQLLGATGVLAVAPGSKTEWYAGALSAAEIPEILALARESTGLPARTEIILTASLGDAPVQVKIERDKKGRLEVQVRGIPFADRARFFEVVESFLARGAFDVRVEGPVGGKHVEARFRERAPETPAVSTAALPAPTPGAADAGQPVELFGRWRSTTVRGAILLLRPQAGGLRWDYEAPQSAGLNFGRGAFRAEGNGRADAQGLTLFGRIVAGDFVAGTSSTSMSLVLRREGSALRGTATGSRNVPITIEFVKDGP